MSEAASPQFNQDTVRARNKERATITAKVAVIPLMYIFIS